MLHSVVKLQPGQWEQRHTPEAAGRTVSSSLAHPRGCQTHCCLSLDLLPGSDPTPLPLTAAPALGLPCSLPAPLSSCQGYSLCLLKTPHFPTHKYIQNLLSWILVFILFSVSSFAYLLELFIWSVTVNQSEIWNCCCLAFPAKALFATNKCKGGEDSNLLFWRTAKLPAKPHTCSWIPHLSHCCAGSWPLSVILKWYRAQMSLRRGV